MFDLGWTELLVIGVVALIVVGPKDLPKMFRTLGRFTGKLRGMAREFSRAMEDAADDAGVKDVAKDLKNVTNPRKMGLDALDDAANSFKKWDPDSETGKLAKDRADAAKKIHEATAKKEQAKRESEAAAQMAESAPASEPGAEPAPEAPKET
ncbi:MAG: Sec-independent protein translocase protein TatB [Dinoroseobacter sp.]|nr:Sec-independent protein translocase protein TatB [Dinoroseobacter sp.]MDJ0994074.1 Sec-independent protein translocase protein TatB [Dinoroseobacter sp.]